jgi:hypothetical protein
LQRTDAIGECLADLLHYNDVISQRLLFHEMNS